MSKPNQSKSFVDSLLAGDRGLSEAQYAEYRQKLEGYFVMARRRMRQTKTTVLVMWGLFVISWFAMLAGSYYIGKPANDARDVGLIAVVEMGAIGIVLAAVYFVSFVLAVLYTGLLFVNSYTVSKARQTQRDIVMLDLQRKLNEISERLPPGEGATTPRT